MSNKVMSFARLKDIPEPLEIASKSEGGFVQWGKDNLYPQFLNQLFYDSAYQSGIIRGKVYYITSSGLDLQANNAEQLLKLKQFLLNDNAGYSINEIIEALAFDNEMYNGFCFKIVWNKEGGISYLEHVDFDKIRTNKDFSKFFYSDDWSSKKQDEELTGYKEYLPFNKDLNRGEALFYYRSPNKSYPHSKSKADDMGIYPKPTYQGGVKDLMSDVEISSFHFYELINGMKAGTLVTLTNGAPDEEERRAVEAAYKKGLTNVEGAGGVMLQFVNGQEEIPDIQNLNGNDLDKRYLMTEEAVRKKIFVSHSVTTPAIFGIATQGALGSQQEMEQGYQIFTKTYVRGRQKQLEQAINFVISCAGITGSIELKEPEPLFKSEVEEVEEVEFKDSKKDEFKTTDFNDILIGKLAQLGRARSKKVVSSREVKEGFATEEQEAKIIKKCMNKVYYFLDALEDFHLNILKMLTDGQDADSISKALDISPRKLTKAVTELREGGYLSEDYEVTEKGKDVILVEGKELQEFEVVYTYELRSDAPALVSGGSSRPFCEAVTSLNREYTRLEIESLNDLSPFAKEGLDVWNYRGGWYTNPNTGQHSPSCRHIWKQKVIFK